MSISDMLLPEFDQEIASTRTALERVPAEKFAWSPHEKSGTMGWLAGHLANIPTWASMTINQSERLCTSSCAISDSWLRL